MAMDRDAITSVIFNPKRYQDMGVKLNTYWNNPVSAGWGQYWLDPKGKDFGPAAQYLKFNVAEAKKLMDAAGFSQAAQQIEQTYSTHVITHVCMESHCCVAEWEGNKLTAWLSTQGVHGSAQQFAQALGILRQLRDLVSDPSGAGAATEQIRALIAQLTDLGKAQSPLWVHRSLRRGLETLKVPLDELRDAAKRLGGTLNTAFLAAAADAAGRYHRELGQPVDTLRASMAISTRTDGSGANAFSLARFVVPTNDLPMADRFQRIHEAAEAARKESGGNAMNALSAVATNLPTSLITRIARQQSQTVDFATSNVRGAPIPLFLAGAQVLQNYPVGPLAGVAFNLTLLSYDHSLDMGVNIDTAAVEQPELLRACLEHAFRDLIAAR